MQLSVLFTRGETPVHAEPIYWGVAFSDTPEGPYTHSEYTPITKSGHETLLWTIRGALRPCSIAMVRKKPLFDLRRMVTFYVIESGSR